MTESDKSPSSDTVKKAGKAYSCIRCFERKVKCDRESPCSNCSKSGVECVFRVPPPPRRRKKRTQEEILKARLAHYEDILRARGIDVYKDGIRAEDLPETTPEIQSQHASLDEIPSEQSTSPWSGGGSLPGRAFVKAKLIVDQGRTRFVENNLWTSMADEFGKPSDAMPEESDDENEDTLNMDNIDFVLGTTPSSMGVRDFHPMPEQIPTLWQIFLENVNPLSKLIHVPTIQPAVMEGSSHLDRLPRNFEALLFAIYTLAVLSTPADECEAMLGESKQVLLTRYIAGTKRALSRARFLGTSDVMVLQAFTLHLLAMRDTYDSKTLWTLTGVAMRVAEGMGVHRDGASLGLGPFETEMRRRLFWQIVFLDFRTAELSGSGSHGNLGLWDVRIPASIDDVDIWPGMKEAPEPKERGTEMIFCLTRYEIGQFWKTKLLTKRPDGDFATLWSNFRHRGSVEEKEKAVEELEQTLEHKYVRFCDPSVPIEFMAILVTRAATNGMRLMAHHPRRYEKDEDVPESERRLLWTIGSKLLEIDNLVHSSKPMRRFLWHNDHHFQWQALIYMLTELKKHPLNEQVDRGWQLVHEIFENHPYFVTDLRKPMHFAIGSLCLKAWKARADTWSERSFAMPLRTPEYIKQLQKDREEKTAAAQTRPTQPQNDYLGFHRQPFHEQMPETAPATDTSQSMMPTSQPGVNLPIQAHELAARQNELNENVRQTQLPPELQFSQPNPQQPQQFWLDFGREQMGLQVPNPGFDFNQLQFPVEGLDPMDWTQWDFLLKDVRQTG